MFHNSVIATFKSQLLVNKVNIVSFVVHGKHANKNCEVLLKNIVNTL